MTQTTETFDGFRQVQKKGIYFHGKLYRHAELCWLIGEQVRVFFAEAEAEYLHVYTLDGRFICRAEDPELTGLSRQDLVQAVKEGNRRVQARSKRQRKQ